MKIAEAYNNLGQALKTLGRIEEARNYFLKAIALRPNFTQAILNHQEVATICLFHLKETNFIYVAIAKKMQAIFVNVIKIPSLWRNTITIFLAINAQKNLP